MIALKFSEIFYFLQSIIDSGEDDEAGSATL